MLKELLKEILKEEITGKKVEKQRETLATSLYGKICMFRTYSAGVHFGELVAKNGQECHVKNARRVWYWKNACSLSQLATDRTTSLSDSQIAVAVPEIILDQVIEVIPMTPAAVEHLRGAPVWKK
jgi:hypothetical protein